MADYISLNEATKYCNYSADYLKLRARQRKLRAVKIGRNWVTTKEWAEEYLGRTSIKHPRKVSSGVWVFSIMSGLVLTLIIIGVLVNFDISTEYFQWVGSQTKIFLANIGEVIPSKIIEIK